MAINKTNRLAWIVKTIYKAKKITFEELANKWNEDDNINGGKPLSKKSFHTRTSLGNEAIPMGS